MFRLVNKLKNRKGFTLIELIVVLAVLAIIMAIAVPRFMGVQDKAKEDADQATVDNLAKSAELYYARTGDDTITYEELVNGNYIDSDLGALKSENTSISGITFTLDEDTGSVEASLGSFTSN